MAAKILLVEDDAAISLALCDRLESEGYESRAISDGSKALALLDQESFDLVLLDIMLPGKNGIEICRDLRSRGNMVPIIMLTARGEVTDRVVGLRLGADDYVAKPFEMSELMARIEAVMRRSVKQSGPQKIVLGEYEFDSAEQKIRGPGGEETLTSYEYKLLFFLCSHRGQVLDRNDILTEVWGYENAPFTRTVDIHIGMLRKKLGDARKQEMIRTIRGQGYRLD
jgi:DNA-binding response OmpR family regulator